MIELLAPLLIHTVEAFHDKAVIDGQKTNGEKWHKIDFLLWSVVYAVFVYLGGWWFLVFGVLSRLLIMQILLNILRGHRATHLGRSGIDGWCYKYLGENATLILKILVFTLSLITWVTT